MASFGANLQRWAAVSRRNPNMRNGIRNLDLLLSQKNRLTEGFRMLWEIYQNVVENDPNYNMITWLATRICSWKYFINHSRYWTRGPSNRFKSGCNDLSAFSFPGESKHFGLELDEIWWVVMLASAEYYTYQFQSRPLHPQREGGRDNMIFNPLRRAGKLTQQFFIDCWIHVESGRLAQQRTVDAQNSTRAATVNGFSDCLMITDEPNVIVPWNETSVRTTRTTTPFAITNSTTIRRLYKWLEIDGCKMWKMK